jgi:radical SAM protein with 4Fe4S-binding SPASM domain
MSKCELPWTNLVILTGGECFNCCYQDVNLPLGNINNDSIDNIWNSEKSQAMRQEWLDGKIPNICKTGINNCMFLGRV